jgi:hypothetical protein
LQPQQLTAERGGQHFRDFGFADAGFAFEKNGSLQAKR